MNICSIWRPESRRARRAIPVAFFAALSLASGLMPMANAQVVPAGDKGGLVVSVGAMGSESWIQFGGRKMVGVTAFADADTRRRLGLEAEAQFIEFKQTANVHVENYLGGGRYHVDFGRFQPYGKGLAGVGEFNFTDNYGTGSYLVVAGGGGLDYDLTPKIHIRAIDVEYQDWPQFTYGNMTSFNLSAGIRFRVF